MDIKEAKELVLSKKNIEIRPISRNKAFYKEGHDGEFMFTGCTKTYMLPYKYNMRSFTKIFETDQEQEAFEMLMNKEPGSLNIYDRHNKFWNSYTIELTKEGKELDLSNPAHALEYLVLLANHKRIAPDWDSKNQPGYEYALIDKSLAEQATFKMADKVEKAMTLFFKLSKTNKKMFNLLRIMGKSPAIENMANTQWLKSELLAIIEQREQTRLTKEPFIDTFIKAAEDKSFDIKVLIFDAINIGDIQLRGGNFYHSETSVRIGDTLDEAADWLSSVKNQEAKLLIEQRLKLNK